MGNCVSSQPQSSTVEDFVSSLPLNGSIAFGTTTRRIHEEDEQSPPAVNADDVNNIPSRIVVGHAAANRRGDKPAASAALELPTFCALPLLDNEDLPTGSSISGEPHSARPVVPRNPLMPRGNVISSGSGERDVRRVESNFAKLNSYHSSSSTSGAERSAKETDPLDAVGEASGDVVYDHDAAADSTRNNSRDRQTNAMRNSMSVSDHNEGQGMVNSSRGAVANAGVTPCSRPNSCTSIHGNDNEESLRGDAARDVTPLDSNIAADRVADDEGSTTAATTATTTASSASTVSSSVVPWGSLTRHRPPPIIVNGTQQLLNQGAQAPQPPPLVVHGSQHPAVDTPVVHAIAQVTPVAPQTPELPAAHPVHPAPIPSHAGSRRAASSTVVTIHEPTVEHQSRPHPSSTAVVVPRPPQPSSPTSQPISKDVRTPTWQQLQHNQKRTASNQGVVHARPMPHVSTSDFGGPPPGPTPFEAASEYLLFAGDDDLHRKELMWEQQVHQAISGKCWIISHHGWK